MRWSRSRAIPRLMSASEFAWLEGERLVETGQASSSLSFCISDSPSSSNFRISWRSCAVSGIGRWKCWRHRWQGVGRYRRRLDRVLAGRLSTLALALPLPGLMRWWREEGAVRTPVRGCVSRVVRGRRGSGRRPAPKPSARPGVDRRGQGLSDMPRPKLLAHGQREHDVGESVEGAHQDD
jgi:hypothetical protein